MNVKVDLSKICAFYLKREDEDSRNAMEELRQERRDNEARDAQQAKEIMEVIKRLEFVNGKFEKDAIDLGYAIESLKALLLLSTEAGKK